MRPVDPGPVKTPDFAHQSGRSHQGEGGWSKDDVKRTGISRERFELYRQLIQLEWVQRFGSHYRSVAQIQDLLNRNSLNIQQETREYI